VNPCACGLVNLHTAISVWADGVQHFGADLICVQTDDLLVDGAS
jgi:hypothetical protein